MNCTYHIFIHLDFDTMTEPNHDCGCARSTNKIYKVAIGTAKKKFHDAIMNKMDDHIYLMSSTCHSIHWVTLHLNVDMILVMIIPISNGTYTYSVYIPFLFTTRSMYTTIILRTAAPPTAPPIMAPRGAEAPIQTNIHISCKQTELMHTYWY